MGVHALGAIRGVIFFFLVLISLLVYVLSGVTPMISKRFMLPVVLFAPVALLAMTPFLIFHFDRLQRRVIAAARSGLGSSIRFVTSEVEPDWQRAGHDAALLRCGMCVNAMGAALP